MPTITIQTGEFTQEFDCDDEGILREEIQEFLTEHDAKDYSIVDSEEFQGIDVRKYDLERICAIANCIENDHTEGAFVAWYNDQDGESYDSWELEDRFTEQFMGAYDSPADWAQTYLTDTGILGEVPKELQLHIDFKSYVKDWKGSLSFIDIPGSDGIYVFDNR